MKCSELQELAALKAAGALDPAGQARLDAMIAENPDAAEEVSALINAVAAYAGALSKAKTPPVSARASILARIGSVPQLSPVAPPHPAQPGRTFIESSTGGWIQTPVPGMRVKMLSVNKEEGYRIVLTELAPGARLPRHVHHKGSESVFVLTGDLHSDGRRLKAGDFMHSEAGTEHAELWSVEGCQAIIIDPVEGADFSLAHTPH